MTRGRHHNTAHLVADNVEDARAQWVDVFSRDRADLGPGHAADTAAEDIDRYGPLTHTQPSPDRFNLETQDLDSRPAERRRAWPNVPTATPGNGRDIGR